VSVSADTRRSGNAVDNSRAAKPAKDNPLPGFINSAPRKRCLRATAPPKNANLSDI